VPVNATVSKLVKLGGKLPVSFFGGVRYWVESPETTGPEGFGARFGFTVLLPRGLQKSKSHNQNSTSTSTAGKTP